ncbi:MAG: Lrp/AsnC family transcriptional regulator [Flavobacteriaceae bacterium]|nr:Lrp/AsnC family transcriptional regulator [Flavobacteriaceae bacterium]
MNLDAIDQELLCLLQQDSKQTTKQLSLALNLSNTAVYERIKKLERNGIIKKYVALVDRCKMGKSLLAFCHIKLNKHTRDNILNFEKNIKKIPEISECFHVSGDYDYILKIYTKDMASYREFMVSKITNIEQIGNTSSFFIIDEVINSTVVMPMG